jgi:hypothetical protein
LTKFIENVDDINKEGGLLVGGKRYLFSHPQFMRSLPVTHKKLDRGDMKYISSATSIGNIIALTKRVSG